jgi:hypothetical protein
MAKANTDTQETAKFVLPKEARMMMTNMLEVGGFHDVDALSDDELFKKYNDHAMSMQKENTTLKMDSRTKRLNEYLTNNEKMKITDKVFIDRLFSMNVPYFYLHLFDNDDIDLTDAEIWSRINKSNINPVKEVQNLYKMKRSPLKRKINQTIYMDA